MKKLLLFVAVAFFGFTAANAQNGDFKVGLNLGLPVGDAGDVADFSVGLDAAYLFEVSDKFDAGVATGFTNAFIKSEFDGADDVQFLPIAAAGRYNVSDDFYLGADLGYAVGINDDNEGGFYYRPRVGYSLSEKIGLNLSYTGISVDDVNWSTINLGVEFGL